jgi:hypothetical protein
MVSSNPVLCCSPALLTNIVKVTPYIYTSPRVISLHWGDTRGIAVKAKNSRRPRLLPLLLNVYTAGKGKEARHLRKQGGRACHFMQMIKSLENPRRST